MLGCSILLASCRDDHEHEPVLLGKEIDLGVVPPAVTSIGFQVTNESEETWRVTSIESACASLEVEVSEQTTRPGERVLVMGSLDGRGAAGPDFNRCWLVQEDGPPLVIDLVWFTRGQAIARPDAVVVERDEQGLFRAAFDVCVPGVVDPPSIGLVDLSGDAAIETLGPSHEEIDPMTGVSQVVFPVTVSGTTLYGRPDEDRKVVVRLADFNNPHGDIVQVSIVCVRRRVDVSPRVLIMPASAREQPVRLALRPPPSESMFGAAASPPTLGVVEYSPEAGELWFRWGGQRAVDAALVLTLDGITERVPILFAEAGV